MLSINGIVDDIATIIKSVYPDKKVLQDVSINPSQEYFQVEVFLMLREQTSREFETNTFSVTVNYINGSQNAKRNSVSEVLDSLRNKFRNEIHFTKDGDDRYCWVDELTTSNTGIYTGKLEFNFSVEEKLIDESEGNRVNAITLENEIEIGG